MPIQNYSKYVSQSWETKEIEEFFFSKTIPEI